MLHSEQKCDHFCSEWSIVGYWTGAFWDFWNWSIVLHSVNHCFIRLSDKMFPNFKWTPVTGTAAFKVTMSSLWWRHQMENLRVTGLCEGNSPVTREFPSKRSVTRNFDVFFGLRPNKRSSKPSRRRRFETPSRSLWGHCAYHLAFQLQAHTITATAR